MPSSGDRKTRRAVLTARENIRLIREWSPGTLEAIRADLRTRYAIERAFLAIDAAVRDIPRELAAAHAIPVDKISGFRNVLAHTYEDLLDERVLLTIEDDLPSLDGALARLLDALGHDDKAR